MDDMLAQDLPCLRKRLSIMALVSLLPALLAGGATAATGQADATRVATGLVTLYDFAQGSGEVVPDVSAAGSPLDLVIADTTAVCCLSGVRLITRSAVGSNSS